MDKNILEKIKTEISNSDSLDWSDKIDAEILLDTASKALKVREHFQIIRILSDLYDEITGEEYKEALHEVLKKYREEIRILSYDSVPEPPISLKEFLKHVGIETENIPEKLLKSKLLVAIDDGMGYSPKGFQDVLDAYLDEESGEIRIWI